jgi:hypothetical protein
MRTVYRYALAVTGLALGVALPSAAQEAPAQQDVIDQLQAKSALTDEDRAKLREWVGQRVQAIVAGDPSGSAEAVSQLRKRFTGTDGFKEAFAAVTAELIGSAYKQAKRDSAARLLAVLNTLNQVSSYKVLIEALGDKRVPVRSAAAIGLRRLQDNLARAGGDALSESITALREAGKRETSPVALQLIYRAMDYTGVKVNPPDPKAGALALLELLEARGEQYQAAAQEIVRQPDKPTANNVKAEGADRPGLELAGKLIGQMDEQGRQRLIVACAKMLHYAVIRYTSELHKIEDKTSSPLQIALRDRMELFIMTAEELLAKLTPFPKVEGVKTIAAEMQEQEQDKKAVYMKIAMNAWADVLQERFQFDLHIKGTEPEPEQGDLGDEEEAPEP